MEQIGAPPRVQPKIGKNVLSCGVIAVVFTLLLICGLAYLISESGLVSVPGFSRWYQGPQPVRQVPTRAVDTDEIRAVITERLQSQLQQQVPPPYRVRLDESELSSALASNITLAERGKAWRPMAVQLAVRPDGLEFSGTFAYSILRVHVLAMIEPVVEGSSVHFQTKSVQIGDFHVAPDTATKFMSLVFSRDLGTWDLNFGVAALRNISLQDGYLDLVIVPTSP